MKDFPLQAPVKDFLELSQCPQLSPNPKSGSFTGNVLPPLCLILEQGNVCWPAQHSLTQDRWSTAENTEGLCNSSLNVYCAPSSKTTPKPNESEFYCYVWLWRGVIWATGGSFYKYLPSHLCWYTCWTSWMHQYWISSALPEGQSNSEAHPVTCTHYQQCSREYAGRGGKHVIATASSKPAAQHSLWFHQYLKHLSEGSWVTECHNTELKTIQMSLLLK